MKKFVVAYTRIPTAGRIVGSVALGVKRLRGVIARADRNPKDDVRLSHEEVEAIRSVLHALDESAQREAVLNELANPEAYIR